MRLATFAAVGLVLALAASMEAPTAGAIRIAGVGSVHVCATGAVVDLDGVAAAGACCDLSPACHPVLDPHL